MIGYLSIVRLTDRVNRNLGSKVLSKSRLEQLSTRVQGIRSERPHRSRARDIDANSQVGPHHCSLRQAGAETRSLELRIGLFVICPVAQPEGTRADPLPGLVLTSLTAGAFRCSAPNSEEGLLHLHLRRRPQTGLSALSAVAPSAPRALRYRPPLFWPGETSHPLPP